MDEDEWNARDPRLTVGKLLEALRQMPPELRVECIAEEYQVPVTGFRVEDSGYDGLGRPACVLLSA